MLVLKSLGGSFEEVFGRLITFSRFTKDFTRTVLGSPNNQMTPQTTPKHINICIIYIIYILYDKESDHSYKAVRTCPQKSDG